jgi:hypothetical protein
MENINQNQVSQSVKRNLPRDVFLHLLAIVALYWSSITFVTLLWQFINYFLPDALANVYQYQARFELMRFAVSSLFIVFPVFIFVSWYLNKIYKKESVVRESKIRKWLLYLTLFVAALVVIGDLVAVINNLLGGETTIRFVLKALSVFLVAGLVFGYYLDDVRKFQPTKLARPFAWGSSVLVLIAIIGSFFVIGSPNSARLAQIDMQRVSDLDGIQSAIINYWQAKEKIPTTLDDLKDSISGYSAPQDPETKQYYEYRIIDADGLKFELCANFSKKSNEKEMGYTQPMYCPVGVYCAGNIRNWSHPEGRYCFERIIDKKLYPPTSKTK